MVNKLRRATDEAKCKLYDSVWCVLDADKYGDAPEVTAKLIKSAQKHGVKLAISNPCFEVWYLCHASNGYSSSSLTSAEAKKKAAQLLGHDWNAPARHFKALRDFLPRAVENARLVRSAHFEFDPVQSNRCTSVDELLIDVGLATLDNERG